MDILHTAKTSQVGAFPNTDRSGNSYVNGRVTSILNGSGAPNRNIVAVEQCNRTYPPDLDLIFDKYQPLYRVPYDLGNCFDRTNLAIVIRGHIDRCEDYIALARRLHHDNRMSTQDFAHRVGERCADLREHRTALFRLNELGRN